MRQVRPATQYDALHPSRFLRGSCLLWKALADLASNQDGSRLLVEGLNVALANAGGEPLRNYTSAVTEVLTWMFDVGPQRRLLVVGSSGVGKSSVPFQPLLRLLFRPKIVNVEVLRSWQTPTSEGTQGSRGTMDTWGRCFRDGVALQNTQNNSSPLCSHRSEIV